MAIYNHSCVPFFTALILLASLAPGTATIQRPITITGRLCCTPTGNCPGTPVLGAQVNLTCNSAVVGQATTNGNGDFNIQVIGLNPFQNPRPCLVAIRLPLNQTACAVLSTGNGIIVGSIGFIILGNARVDFFNRIDQ